jgi:hypothetical protein
MPNPSSDVLHNKYLEPKKVCINNIPGFGDVKYHSVPHPSFMDHSLQPCVSRTDKFTQSELETFLRSHKNVYVLQCIQTWEDERQDTYQLTYHLSDEWLLAPLIKDIKIDDFKLDPNSFVPTMSMRIDLNCEAIQNLATSWGRDEAVRQLGEYIISAIETKDDQGEPPLEDINSINSHPVQTQ